MSKGYTVFSLIIRDDFQNTVALFQPLAFSLGITNILEKKCSSLHIVPAYSPCIIVSAYSPCIIVPALYVVPAYNPCNCCKQFAPSKVDWEVLVLLHSH